MDKVVARKLRPHEGRKLKQLSNAVNCRRARIILLSRRGFCNREVAEFVGLSPAWVRVIIHRFNQGSVESITWYPFFHRGGGRASRFTADVVEEIAEVALAPPFQLVGMTVWSLPKLRDYLIEQGIVESISIEWLRQILRRHRVRWRHTKTWKESNDPEFEEKRRRIHRLYQRRRPGGVRLCFDELGPLNLLPRHGKHYARIGHVDRLRATYHRTGGVRYFLAIYDLEQDTLHGYPVKQKNRRTFLAFLRWLRRTYRGRGTLHIVLDNATFHSRPEVLAYAAANDIRFYWTPTNASWLNRIEAQFTALVKFTLHNTDYASHDDMQAAIRGYLRWRNGRRRITVEQWSRAKRRAA